jgi:hypothetical protein
MKTVVLFGITLLAVAPALAQTSAPASADPANKTVTLTGCVGGGSGTAPITLSQAMIVPATPQPDETPSPVPSSVSSPATQPPEAALPPSGAAAVTPSPTGTSGTKMPGPGTAGTTGVMTGTAPAGSSGSSVTGYRLSGADMQPWIGKRVQLVGTFAPAAAAPAGSTAGSTTASAVTGGASAPPALEFRVQAVQPVTGPCSKP